MFFFFLPEACNPRLRKFLFCGECLELSFVPWNEEIVCGISRAFDRDERV